MILLPQRPARAPRLVLLLLLALASCQGETGPGTDEVPGQSVRREATRVRTTPVEMREMIRRLETTAEVESEKEIEVYPRTAGVIVEVLVEEGDRVELGDVLARIDQREAKATLEDLQIAEQEARDGIEKARIAKLEAESLASSSKLSYEKACRDFDRHENAGLISATELDNLRLTRDTALGTWEANKLALERAQFEERAAQTAVRRAKLAVERQELELSYTEITAPFAGEIAQRMCRVGDSVSSSAAVFVLTDAEDLRVVFMRPQRELTLFAAGLQGNDNSAPGAASVEITATAEALPGRVFRGEIQRLSPIIETESGAFRVTARLEQPPAGAGEPRLLPGMLVRLSIVTDRHPNALVVPKRAVQREGDTLMLFVVRDGRAARVRVREGYADDDHVEVLPVDGAELRAGEPVVVVGNRDLEDGDEVEVEVPERRGEEEEGSEEATDGDGVAAEEDAREDDAPVDEDGDEAVGRAPSETATETSAGEDDGTDGRPAMDE